MKHIFLCVSIVGCSVAPSAPLSEDRAAIAAEDNLANCDPATPPQCMSLAEAAPLATSPNFAPWFTAQICPIGVGPGDDLVQLTPWFCDSTQWFPEACMPVFTRGPTVALQVACCHPGGEAIANACTTDADCPFPHSECFMRYCAPTGVCAISAKQEGHVCPSGEACISDGEACSYSGAPPLCVP